MQSRVYELAAEGQDNQIFWVICKGGEWTADDLHEREEFKGFLLTSIRRALSNLSKGGYIEVVGKKEGKYKRNVLVWKMKPMR